MIIPSTTKILIVPDFGRSADDEAMVALKQTIEAKWRYSVKIVNLLQMVRDEHPDEELKDSVEIEMCARKLEALADDKTLEWGDMTDDDCEDPVLDRYLDDDDFDCTGFEDDSLDPAVGVGDVKVTEELIDKVLDGRLKITKTVTDGKVRHVPDVLVVFGKSVMLAGGVKDKPILFVDPVYDSEWPWKKQYYADRDAASDFVSQFWTEMNEPEDTQVLWEGTEVRRRPHPVMRYGLFTDDDRSGVFHDRYCNLWMINEELNGDPEKLANTICEFAEGDMDYPLLDIYRMIEDGCWTAKYPVICRFDEPVDLGYATVLGLERGVPMANGQSGIKLRITDRSYPIPLESIRDRKGLTALRDAVAKVFEKLPQRKRILIVPDYFTPYNAPNVVELREQLRMRGYYVAVFVAGNTLEQSQRGIERRCKKKPFDLIVTLETGCLLASRVMNAPRIFVDPDWAAWEWMKLTLGEDKKQYRTRGFDNSSPFWSYYLNAGEIAEARKMAERSFIRKGEHCVYGWFSEDNIEESRLTEEHIKRFNICAYIPGMRLDTDEGIRVLANEIDKIMKIDAA